MAVASTGCLVVSSCGGVSSTPNGSIVEVVAVIVSSGYDAVVVANVVALRGITILVVVKAVVVVVGAVGVVTGV